MTKSLWVSIPVSIMIIVRLTISMWILTMKVTSGRNLHKLNKLQTSHSKILQSTSINYQTKVITYIPSPSSLRRTKMDSLKTNIWKKQAKKRKSLILKYLTRIVSYIIRIELSIIHLLLSQLTIQTWYINKETSTFSIQNRIL